MLMLFFGQGCEEKGPPAPSQESAAHHAQIFGANRGHQVVRDVQELILLHPNSDRQRQSRRQLLKLQRLLGDEAAPEPGRRKDNEGIQPAGVQIMEED